jgi:hypothetical protein
LNPIPLALNPPGSAFIIEGELQPLGLIKAIRHKYRFICGGVSEAGNKKIRAETGRELVVYSGDL